RGPAPSPLARSDWPRPRGDAPARRAYSRTRRRRERTDARAARGALNRPARDVEVALDVIGEEGACEVAGRGDRDAERGEVAELLVALGLALVGDDERAARPDERPDVGQQLAWPVERTGQAPPVQVAREEEREEHQRHVDDAAPAPGVLRYVAQAVEVGPVPGRPVFARVPVRVPAARVGLEAEHLQPPRLVAPPAAQRGRERGRVEPVRNADVRA